MTRDLQTISNKIDHATLQMAFALGKLNRVKHTPGEKIRVLFIFQSASFWPSWESIWERMSVDERFDCRMILSDKGGKEKIQFQSAAAFLNENGIEYTHFDDFNIDAFNPHIVFMHTPYDGHRPRPLHSRNLVLSGYRLIYIPYGIEISDIDKARADHFTLPVTNLSWRIYSFSPQIVPYYKMFSHIYSDNVKGYGHPKFDAFKKENGPEMPAEILSRAKGRPIILLKVHFPKKVGDKFITPNVDIYKKFLTRIKSYYGIFVVFMPHPKFYEQLAKYEKVARFKNIFKNTENVYEYNGDDYRPVLMNADYHIVDRSALMIEAGYTEKPVLYVRSKPEEKMTAPVANIISQYYQADNAEQLLKFVETVALANDDPLKEVRLQTINEVIPHSQSSYAELIIEDIVRSINEEKQEVKDDPEALDKLIGHISDIMTQDEVAAIQRELAVERVKQQLSYRLGQELVKSGKSPFGWVKLPKRLYAAYREFKASGRAKN